MSIRTDGLTLAFYYLPGFEISIIHCMLILKQESAELKNMYDTYKQGKRSWKDGETVLAFRDFVFLHTIRTNNFTFVLDYTKLAYDMMTIEPTGGRPSSSESFVTLERFNLYAPYLGLASSLFSAVLFNCLANQGQLVFEPFRAYVDEMRKCRKDTIERLPVLQALAQDKEQGTLVMTRQQLIFETSLFKSRVNYVYASLRLDEGDSLRLFRSAKMQASMSTGCVLALSLIGIGEQIEREQEFLSCCLKDLLTVHAMAKKLGPDHKARGDELLEEMSRRVQANRVLCSMGYKGPVISPFSGFRHEEAYRRFQDQVCTLQGKRIRGFWLRPSLGNWGAQELDPTRRMAPWPTLSQLQHGANTEAPIMGTSEVIRGVETFDYKLLATNVGLLIEHLQPLFMLYDAAMSLKKWEQPVLSLTCCLLLLSLSYYDLLSYTPGIALFGHGLFLCICRCHPRLLAKLFKNESDSAERRREAELDRAYENANLLVRLKLWKQKVKYNVSKLMSGLEQAQVAVGYTNLQLVRFGTLYLWTSEKASVYYTLGLMCFALATFLPFRILFAVWTLDFFTDHFQQLVVRRGESGFFRLLALAEVTEGNPYSDGDLTPFCRICSTRIGFPGACVEAGEEGDPDEGSVKSLDRSSRSRIFSSEEARAIFAPTTLSDCEGDTGYAGWLDRKRGFLSNWKRRWFIAYHAHLVYYNHPRDRGHRPPKGVIHLSGGDIVGDPGPSETGGRCLFVKESLDHSAPKMSLLAPSVALKQQWVNVLSKASVENVSAERKEKIN